MVRPKYEVNMKVNREQLLGVLEMVAPGLSTRGDIEQSNCFVFSEGRIITYNDDTACIHKSPLDESIKGAVQAEPLRQILNKLKDESLDISQGKDELLIKGKSGRRVGVRMEKKIELPLDNLEKPKKWKALPETFTDAVEFVQGCAGRDDAQFALTCIHIHPKWVEAFDNYQFARFKLEMPIEGDILVRQISLRHIVPLTMIEFDIGDNWIHFRNAAKLVLSCRRYMDEYRNLSKIAKLKGERITLPKGLIEASDRAEVFSVDDPQNDNNIRVDIEPGHLRVKGMGQYGWYTERKKCQYSGKPLHFMIQPKMMIQLVKGHTECEITETALKAETSNAVFMTSMAVEEKKE